MSSSNEARISIIKEVTYGTTPGAGNFKQLNLTSDGLSGNSETTESQTLRTDRFSSGQILVGQTIEGDVSMELAKEPAIDDLMEGAMLSSWASDTPIAVDLTIATGAKTITRATGDWNNDVAVGDVVILSAFSNTGNNIEVMVASINTATEIAYVGPAGMVDEAGSGTSFVVADKVSTGTTKASFSIEKAFNDLTNKAINFTGEYPNTMEINAAYGEPVTCTFGFVGKSRDDVDQAADFMTDGRTIDAQATTQQLNGTIDMPVLGIGIGGAMQELNLCIRSLRISLNNNYTPQTCIGNLGPLDYSSGTAQIEIAMSVYNDDVSWPLLDKKVTQEPISIGFILKNADGFYAVYIPALQLSFADPSAAGLNQDILLEPSGVAKVGASGEAPLTLFKSL